MHKDIEEWKQIQEFPRYYVSSKGRIKSKVTEEEIILQEYTTERGYKTVKLYNNSAAEDKPKEKTVRVHRIVAQYFVKNYSADKEIHHINGITTDNRAENLQCLPPLQHREIHKELKAAAKGENSIENSAESKDNNDK